MPSPPAGIALNPQVPPAGRDEEAVDGRRTHDRRVVDRDVADAGPRPEDAQVAQERQHQRHLPGVAAQRIERRLARIRRLGVELGPDEHLATFRLRRVAHELRGRDDRPEALGVVVGDERVQRVRPDRQTQPDLASQSRHPPAGRREDHPRRDAAGRGLHADHATVIAIGRQGRHGQALEQVHAALRGATRVRPRHAVVPGIRAGQVVRGPQDRIPAAACEVDLRARAP